MRAFARLRPRLAPNRATESTESAPSAKRECGEVSCYTENEVAICIIALMQPDRIKPMIRFGSFAC